MNEATKFLQDAAGYTDKEIAEKFAIEETESEWQIKALGYLDAKTLDALVRAVTEKGGHYDKNQKTTVFYLPKTSSQSASKHLGNEIRNVPLTALLSLPFRTRVKPEMELQELVESIKTYGVLEPILVRPKGDLYEVVAGERRFKAAKTAGLTEIPVIVKSLSDVDAFVIQLSENLQRKDLSEEEKSMALAELAKRTGWKPQQIADKLKMSKEWVYKYLPQDFKDKAFVELGKLSAESVVARRATESEISRENITPTPTLPEETLPTVISYYPKTQETLQLVKCERCTVGTSEPQPWHGHTLCPACLKRAELNPEAFETYFRYFEKSKAFVPVKPETWKPDVAKEAWAFREARMHPQVSQFEIKFDVEAAKAGLPFGESHISVSVKETKPDKTYSLPKGVLYVFFDGKVAHEGHEDRDEALRDLLRKQGATVLPIVYERPTDEALQGAVEQVRAELLRLGWTPTKEA
jgi:ParB/RepB/Spo0J family partition protein